MCTLLPRPFLPSQKTVLCLTRKFVSSWKNPFGSKWLDSVHTTKGYIAHFTSSPLSVVPKISLSPNPKSMLCFGRFQKGRPLLALVWVLALLQNSQIGQFGLFPPLPPRRSLPNPWNFRENSWIVSAKSAGFQPIAASLGFHHAGRVPPSPDSRPSALSFVLESLLIGLVFVSWFR